MRVSTMRINYLLQRRPRRRLYISPGPKILTLRGQVPLSHAFPLCPRCLLLSPRHLSAMSDRTLPRGLRRFLRHYSNRAINVDPSVAGEVYSGLLTVLRSSPPVSAVSPIVFDPLISAWVSHVDTLYSRRRGRRCKR